MYCVFDGGLSIQEYTGVSQASSLPSVSHLPDTEFIRGEGMGGGVGGMVFSIKDGDIICSHANHRGDVIARTDSSGSLTSFALYEAYGTRPYEWGDDPDRQKANTKEEETDLGLLNEGMRFRDLETGTFLARDPIGFKDGPNMYCYVRCNPIMKFDPFGLKFKLVGSDEAIATAQSLATAMYEQASPELKGQIDAYVQSETVITITLVENVKDVLVGNYNSEKIDVGDINKLPTEDSPMSQTATFGHEVMEQAFKQTENLRDYDPSKPETKEDYYKAHDEGKKAEADLNGGYERIGDKTLEADPLLGFPETQHFFHQKDGDNTIFETVWVMGSDEEIEDANTFEREGGGDDVDEDDE
jgi:RHS repeat-associated protein